MRWLVTSGRYGQGSRGQNHRLTCGDVPLGGDVAGEGVTGTPGRCPRAVDGRGRGQRADARGQDGGLVGGVTQRW